MNKNHKKGLKKKLSSILPGNQFPGSRTIMRSVHCPTIIDKTDITNEDMIEKFGFGSKFMTRIADDEVFVHYSNFVKLLGGTALHCITILRN